ncbi:MAG: hemin-degrading factor [Gammaproteobacteria bacterium]|nr:MAG: hemin-degrading factor [Gammaproteobacteria bacterium]
MTTTHPSTGDNATLQQRWQALQAEQPKLRIRDAASALGVSEAELLNTRLGDGVVRLDTRWNELFKSLHTLGSVMALTRNDDVVHERHGVYENFESVEGHSQIALFVNPDIDLRIFLRHWSLAFAVSENGPHGERRSLQFFDKDGEAVHKIYLTDNSDVAAYQTLVEQHRLDVQDSALNIKPVERRVFNRPDSSVDVAALQQGWDGLKDTHDFYPLLQGLKVDRLQALHLAGEQRACQVQDDSLRKVLTEAAAQGLEIMVFVGSRGMVQIHTGPVHTLKAVGEWYNVLDPEFNLHVRESAIASIWRVIKPTEDGDVTALECYDADGNQLVQLFGKRKPGIPELTAWRELVNALEPKQS